jgi:hypothetical protein
MSLLLCVDDVSFFRIGSWILYSTVVRSLVCLKWSVFWLSLWGFVRLPAGLLVCRVFFFPSRGKYPDAAMLCRVLPHGVHFGHDRQCH